jgi:GDP-4-dehydro-6-deoxy-D-mannose reductase
VSRLLITGADGFVGRWLTREALQQGWEVVLVIGPGGAHPSGWLTPAQAGYVTHLDADFTSEADLQRVAQVPVDAIVHLAAMASGAAARKDPTGAMQVNLKGSARLLNEVESAGHRPRFLFVSTGEVYGAGHHGPITEEAELNPASPYAESKAAAEVALTTYAVSRGSPLIIARPFTHSGPGQAPMYVLPGMVQRLREAKRTDQQEIPVGNLDPVRDFLDVRDVVRAYLLLLKHGVPGEAYNVASGVGHRLGDCFAALARIVGVDAVPVADASLVRPADISVLIGDPSKLHAATGWTPQIPFEQTLQDLVDAQAD